MYFLSIFKVSFTVFLFLLIFLLNFPLNIILSFIFFENQINLLSFITGNFLGGAIFILAIKLVVNIPTLIKEKFKTN